MSNSYIQTVNWSCSQCRRAFDADVWLIVDIAERPDLLEQLLTNTLHHFSCPYCNYEERIDAPLLIYVADSMRELHESPLLFSPEQDTSAEEDREQVVGLLKILRFNLGPIWRDEWLPQMSLIQPHLLADTLSNKLQRKKPSGRRQAADFGYIPPELLPILPELAQPASPTDMPRRIELCHQALSVVTRDQNPTLWAMLHKELAESLYQNPLGDRGKNIEQAISAYEQALEVITRYTMPVEWARTINHLGVAHYARVLGERAEDIERAIDAHQQALTVMTRDAMPVEWAGIMTNLGNVYADRILGEPVKSTEQAIDAYQQALQVRTREDMPTEWAITMMNLGRAYTKRGRGLRVDNIEQAIDAYQQALAVLTQNDIPTEWAQTVNNLAIAYVERIRGERTENIERAIDNYQGALKVRTQAATPVEWAATMMNLANAYCLRVRGDRAQNLEQAIACYQQALTVRSRNAMPIEWAQTKQNLASAYAERIRGDRTENLEQAIALYEQALTVINRDTMPIEWVQIMQNLASIYTDRIRGDRAENLEQAIALYEQALTVMTPDAMPVEWAQTKQNLAIAYRNRVRGDHAQNVEAAIAAYQQALTVMTQDAMPADHRLTQRNLGILAISEQQWDLAVNAFHEALTAADLLYTIASTPEARQAELREVSGLPAELAYALARLNADDSTALTVAVISLERNRARWLAESLAFLSEKPASVPATLWQRFTETATSIQQLQAEAQLPDNTTGKRDFLTLSNLLAEVRADLSQVIEEIRSFAPEFMPTPSLGDIQGAFAATGDAQAEVGIYVLTTTQGGLALILHAGNVIPVWLDTLTDAMSRTLLQSWSEAYDAFLYELEPAASRVWSDCLDATTQRLWELAIGPITATLDKVGLSSHGASRPPVVTLIPTGLLALLPLHAAWTDDITAPSVRRYFLDDYAVRYAPSATALRHCRKRVDDTSVEHLLALDEPKPISRGGPLPNSAREVKAIASLFSVPTVLQHEQASHATTRRALSGAQVAHFSCHGANNWQNPLDSGLFLANDEPLTVRDFLERHLPNARLATLSACETGMIGGPLPDEVIMLPSALVQAGYAGVVASLWSVADVSTAMLMVRFYQYWREDGLEPVYALRSAQRWLRDTTNQEKADYFGQFVPGLGTRMADTVAAEFFSAAMLAADGPEARSFAHPFWWGAFYLTGV